jgi:hypothetical protein
LSGFVYLDFVNQGGAEIFPNRSAGGQKQG